MGINSIGYFLGKKAVFLMVDTIGKCIWGSMGLIQVLSDSKGFFYLRFLDMYLQSLYGHLNDECKKPLEAKPLPPDRQRTHLNRRKCSNLPVIDLIKDCHASAGNSFAALADLEFKGVDSTKGNMVAADLAGPSICRVFRAS
ncbi:hypothetical protein Nepgr_000760 [Nepenthes gracilis]|uniref:Uncharacterized protein n=1 Tax=Nepenthes gracilis TaxID=150966 RepID=A0AAD3P3R0_NEPGR|nr:hypothetical protein Nepgr_000760 [Nepenthes gracilis]